jgi:predicted GNAT family acetyltransferase
MAVVTKNADAKRFEITDDDAIAMLTYHEGRRHITLIHTEVPPALGGRGYGGELAKFALEYARTMGLRVIVHCPFVRAYLERHPEYADLTNAS